MAKVIEYDVEGVEESQGGTGVKVKPGVRVAKIAKCSYRDKKSNGDPANDLEVALNVGEEYDWVFTYVGLGKESDWKLAEFTRALGMKDKGKFDPDKLVDKLLRVRIVSDTYNNEYAPRAGRLMKPQPGDTWGEAASELSSQNGDAPDGPEPDADAPGASANGYANPEFVASREGDEGIGSYDDWKDEDLVAECEDRGLTLPGGRGSKRDKAIAALRAEDSSVTADAEAVADGTAADHTTGGDDYDDWDIDKLKAEWEARQMGDLPAIRGRNAADRLVAEIVKSLREDDQANPFS